MGHSMGSFMVQKYELLYPNRFNGHILMGAAKADSLFKLGYYASLFFGFFSKPKKRLKIMNTLAFGSFNKAFKPNKTDFDWLCADEEELQKYMLDSACADSISSGLFWQLLSSMRYTGSKSAYQNWKKDMPVLLLSGEKDPVGDFTKGVRRVEAAMKNVGMKNVTVQFLPEARHDIFHEVKSECAKKVVQLIKNWINA